MSVYYNASQVDALLATKADIGHTHPQMGTDLAEIIRNVTIEMLSNSTGDVSASYDPVDGWTFAVHGKLGTVNVLDKIEFKRAGGLTIAELTALMGTGFRLTVNEPGTVQGILKVGNLLNGDYTEVGRIEQDGLHFASVTTPKFTVTTHNFDLYMPVGNADQSVDTGLSRAFYDGSGTLVINKGGDFFNGVTCPTEIGAASFNVVSRRDAKDEVSGFSGAIDILRQVKLARFRYKEDREDAPLRVGIIADESPVIVTANGRALDLANLAGIVFGAVKELIARQEFIEAGGVSCQ